MATRSIRLLSPTTWPAWSHIIAALAVVLSALVLWSSTLSASDIRTISDVGLVSVLPLGFYMALGMLTISFMSLLIDRNTPQWLLLIHVIAFVIIVHGTPALLYDLPRYAWTFKHIGVSEYFQRYGIIDPHIDIYFNWPGFFALNALISEVAGFSSPMDYASWAPLCFNVLNIGALFLIFQALTPDRRHIWLAIWLFSLTNWVGQDYFSPQALGYFFYLLVIGMCLTWYPASFEPTEAHIVRWFGWLRLAPLVRRIVAMTGPTSQGSTSEHGPKPGLFVLLIAFFSIIVVSHQLTPMLTIISVTGLVVVGRCRARHLPWLMVVLTISWIIYGAGIYTEQALAGVIAAVSRFMENIRENVTDLSTSTPGRTFVALSCRVLSASLWGLALLGGIRRWRNGKLDLSVAILAVSPFLILPFQAYGGEMLFRVYYFSLPFMAWFAAALFFPRPTAAASWGTMLLAVIVSCGLLTGLLVAYYGNERMNNFSQDELAGAEYLYAHAPEGALVLTADLNTPIRYRNYEKLFLISLTDEGYIPGALGTPQVNDVAVLMDYGMQREAYFFVTRSQKEYIELFSLMPQGWLDRLEADLVNVPTFELIFSNRDAKLFLLKRDAPGAMP
jgi:hypothetical protein